MSRFLILGLGLLAFAILVYVCIRFHVPQIEADLRQRSVQALGSRGLSFAGITVDGRDITLSGRSPSAEAKHEAVAEISNVRGVRKVHDRLTVNDAESTDNRVAPSAPPYQLRLQRSRQKLHIEGQVPNAAEREHLLEVAQQSLPETAIESNLALRDPAPTDWSLAAEAVIAGLALTETGQADLQDQRWSLRGAVVDANQAYQLRQTLDQRMPDTYQGQSDISLDLSEAGQVCQLRFNQLLAGKRIQFLSGNSELQTASFPLLNQLAEAAKACPKVDILITGHTDSSGGAELNLRISQARARAVVTYLQNRGVLAERLSVVGYGATRPIADNQTRAGRALNRRIEFVVREPKP